MTAPSEKKKIEVQRETELFFFPKDRKEEFPPKLSPMPSHVRERESKEINHLRLCTMNDGTR